MTTAKTEVLAILKANLEKVKAIYAESVGKDYIYVIETGNNGIYYKEGSNMGCGIIGATNYSKPYAEALAPRIQNGKGETGRVVAYGDALHRAIIDLNASITQIENL